MAVETEDNLSFVIVLFEECKDCVYDVIDPNNKTSTFINPLNWLKGKSESFPMGFESVFVPVIVSSFKRLK